MADAAKLRLLLQAARRPDLIASIRNAIPKQFSPDTLRAILDDTFLGQLLPPGLCDPNAQLSFVQLRLVLPYASPDYNALHAAMVNVIFASPEIPPVSVQVAVLLLPTEALPLHVQFRCDVLVCWLAALEDRPSCDYTATLIVKAITYCWLGAPEFELVTLETVFGLLAGSPISPSLADRSPSSRLQALIPYAHVSQDAANSFMLKCRSGLTDLQLSTALQRILQWKPAPGTTSFILTMLKAYVAAGKRSLVLAASRQCIGQILSRSDADPEECWQVARRLLLGYQHASDLFLDALPLLYERVGPDSSLSETSRTEIVDAVRCLMHRFASSGHAFGRFSDRFHGDRSSSVSTDLLREFSWTSVDTKPSLVVGNTIPRVVNPSGLSGLRNLGHTCYMASYLQMLFMSDDFRRRVLASSGGPPITAALRDILGQLTRAAVGEVVPRALMNAISDERFVTGQEADVSEFGLFLHDTIEKSLPTDDETSFGGQMATLLTCDACGISRLLREEPFVELPLAMRGRQSLEHLLGEHFTGTRFDGDNAVLCEGCGVRSSGVTKATLKTCRRFLPFCFKRFTFDTSTMSRKKVFDPVTFPTVLPLGSHVYALYAVIVHSGSRAESGHYYTVARHSDEAVAVTQSAMSNGLKGQQLEHACRQGNWFHFNDSIVSSAGFSFFDRLANDWPLDTPYVCAYVRVKTDR
ncbi:USP domain-containing protein [Plasmodiophora brassicae]